MKNATFAALLVFGGIAAAPALAFPGDGMGGPDFDFATVDKNSDGQISKDELDAFHAARLAEVDKNSDGFVTVEELTAQMQARMADRIAKMAKHMMVDRDDDGDGKLSAAEMAPGARAGDMFARVDTNSDGQISKDEMAAAKARMQEHRQGRGRHHRGDGPMGGFWGPDGNQ